MSNKQIEVGCFAEITGSMTPADGTLVQIFFEEAPDANGFPIWVISEEFPNADGIMSDRCYEYFLKRVDVNEGELCTGWKDVFASCGWVPDSLIERV